MFFFFFLFISNCEHTNVCAYGWRVWAIWRLKSDVNQPRMQYLNEWPWASHHHAESVALDIFWYSVRMDTVYRWSLFSSQITTHKLLKIGRLLWRLRKDPEPCIDTGPSRASQCLTGVKIYTSRKNTSEKLTVVLSRPFFDSFELIAGLAQHHGGWSN